MVLMFVLYYGLNLLLKAVLEDGFGVLLWKGCGCGFPLGQRVARAEVGLLLAGVVVFAVAFVWAGLRVVVVVSCSLRW